MILEENRTASYIRSLYTGNTELLDTIEQEALRDYVPIIRVETQSLLKLLLKQKKPRRILELGTAVGFSALLMCEYAPSDCHVTTIENYEKAGKCDQITLLEGDAMEIIKTLDGPYDFIFVDAAKAQYIHYFPELMRLLEQDGYLVSDNVLQDGDLIQSRFAVERRNRTIHARMREYLYELTHNQELTTSILPVGDGVAVSVKDRKEEQL